MEKHDRLFPERTRQVKEACILLTTRENISQKAGTGASNLIFEKIPTNLTIRNNCDRY